MINNYQSKITNFKSKKLFNYNITRNKIKNMKSKKNKNKKVEVEYVTLICLIILGIILGIMYTMFSNLKLDEEVVGKLQGYSSNLINSKHYIWMLKVVYENIKLPLIILLISLCTNLSTIIRLIVLFKGIVYGVTITLLIKAIQTVGIKYIISMYFPFSLVYILILILFSKISLEYLKEKKCNNSKKVEGNEMIRYIVKVILILLILVVLSIIEINLFPQIIKLVFK